MSMTVTVRSMGVEPETFEFDHNVTLQEVLSNTDLYVTQDSAILRLNGEQQKLDDQIQYVDGAEHNLFVAKDSKSA